MSECIKGTASATCQIEYDSLVISENMVVLSM